MQVKVTTGGIDLLDRGCPFDIVKRSNTHQVLLDELYIDSVCCKEQAKSAKSAQGTPVGAGLGFISALAGSARVSFRVA